MHKFKAVLFIPSNHKTLIFDSLICIIFSCLNGISIGLDLFLTYFSRENCSLIQVGEEIGFQFLAAAVPHDALYANELTDAVLTLKNDGSIQTIYDKYIAFIHFWNFLFSIWRNIELVYQPLDIPAGGYTSLN